VTGGSSDARPSGRPPAAWTPSGVVTLLSDFGMVDAYAGIMSGVVLSAAPDARVVHLTHAVPAQEISLGAMLLRSAVEYFPAGTVHLAVVDPGVGGERDPILVVTDRAVLVGPDNGLLYPAAVALGLREVRRIAARQFFREPVSDTFHGRDVFAPIAGQLAGGRLPREMGPTLSVMRSLDFSRCNDDGDRILGEVVYVDHFGNLISNIPIGDLPDRGVAIDIGGRCLSGIARSYSEVAVGEIVALRGSWGVLEIAQRDGSAAAALQSGRGSRVAVRPVDGGLCGDGQTDSGRTRRGA